MRKSNLLTPTILLIALSAPSYASAQLLVSEFMYDLAEGSDTGREWVEVYNAGATSIDAASWRLYEGEVNHKLEAFQGSSIVPAGGYAIIADNPAKFLIDYPSFSGSILDSAFSLNNAGESFSLRDADLVDRDALSYTSETGAAGDGKSLTRSASDSKVFTPAAPTPGVGALTPLSFSSGSSGGSSGGALVASSSESTAASVGFPVEPQIFAYAGKNRTTVVGADSVFDGKALSKDGELLSGSGIRYAWNFGDGATSERQSAMHHFSYPGKYTVTLDVSSGQFNGTHRITVEAFEPDLRIERLDDGGVKVTNASPVEVDLSFWHVRVGVATFSLAKHTVLPAKSVLMLSPEASRLPAGDPTLLYPNGMPVKTSLPKKELVAQAIVPYTPPSAPARVAIPVVRGEISEPVREEKEGPTPEVQEAQAAAAAGAAPGGMVTWVLGLVALIGIGGIAAALSVSGKPSATDGWDIIDGDGESR